MKGNTNCLVSSGNGKVFEGEYELQPEVASQNILPEWSEYNGPFEDEQTGNVSYDGLSKVKLRKIGSWIDSEISADNIRKGHNILGVTGTYEGRQPVIARVNESSVIEPKISEQTFTVPSDSDGFDSFKVNPVTSTIDANIKPSNIKRNVKILGVTGTYVTENLQDKVVNPTKQQQVVTYDDDVYDGLNSVTVTGVTSTIDENIKAENIKKNVEILGITGTYEETFSTEEKTITPKTVAQSVTPSEGIDGLSRVNVEGVTSAIDANILAENIKKGIEILGVTGNLEATHYNLQDGKIVEPQLVDRTYTADEGYDALLNILVKAVTASIDPNILPKNIKEGIKILGVTGELIEGEEQHWIDYRNIKSFNTMGETTLGGGSWSPTVTDTCENVYFTFNDPDYNAKGINTGKVSAAVFSLVMNYDNLEATDPKLEQIYVYFLNGKYYDTNFNLTQIKDQISYVYSVANDFGINGCLLNSDDVATDKEYNLYVLINSSSNDNKPVLVDGTFAASMYPQGEFLNIKEVGNVVVDKDYIASGFESTSYVTPGNIDFGTTTWEMVFKTKFKSGTDYQRICGTANNTSVAQIVIAVKSDNKLIAWISSNGTGWDIASGIESSNTLENDTNYYIKTIFTGTNYIISTSTDNVNYNEEINVSSSTAISNPNSNFWIGNAESNTYPWQGSIYLKECYIKVNDAFIWKGVENGPLYDQNRYVGKLTVPAHVRFIPRQILDDDGNVITSWILRDRKGVENIVTLHSDKPLTIDVSAHDKNYGEDETLTQKTYILPDCTSEGEISFDSKTFALTSTKAMKALTDFKKKDQCYYYFKFTPRAYGNSGTYYVVARINNVLLLYLYSNGSYFYPGWVYNWTDSSGGGNITNYSYSMQINTTYYYRVYVNGTTTSFSYSTDGTNWTQIDSRSSSYTNPTNDNPLWLYSDSSDVKTVYDASGCYIEKNGSKIWTLAKEVTFNETNHEIIPLTKDLLFYDRNIRLSEEQGWYGNLLNYKDTGGAATMPLYRAKQATFEYKTDFTRPNLTSNGIMGGSNFAVDVSDIYNSSFPAWKAFDGITNSGFWHANNSSSHWIKWYNPTGLRISSLTIYNGDYPDYTVSTYSLLGSNDNSTYEIIVSGTNTVRTNWGSWTIDVNTDKVYKYYRLDCKGYTGSYLYISEIQFNAKQVIMYPEQEVYVLSPDTTFADAISYSNATFVDNIEIPEHDVYEWYKGEWRSASDFSIISQTVIVDADNAEITMKEVEE